MNTRGQRRPWDKAAHGIWEAQKKEIIAPAEAISKVIAEAGNMINMNGNVLAFLQ